MCKSCVEKKMEKTFKPRYDFLWGKSGKQRSEQSLNEASGVVKAVV